MAVVNHLFGSTAMVLPHRHLPLLSGGFWAQDHTNYLGELDAGTWDAEKEMQESYLVHFSDWPLPKPLRPRTAKEWEDALPPCSPGQNESTRGHNDTVGDTIDCPDRKEWVGLYGEYDQERERVCGFLRVD